MTSKNINNAGDSYILHFDIYIFQSAMSIEQLIKLKEKEKIVFIIRRYGLTFFWSWILVFVLFVVPFFFMFWLFNHSWWGQALFFIPVVVGVFILIKTIFIWKKNILVITTHRVVDIDQRGFFDKEVSDVPYSQIEDVSGRIKGFWGTIFRYGNLQIQTGNSNVQIVVEKIKQPVYLQQEINELREPYLK